MLAVAVQEQAMDHRARGTEVFVEHQRPAPLARSTGRTARTRAINEDLDLSQVIGDDTPIRRHGKHFIAKAPWRDDSSPSLCVYPPGTGRYPDSWTWYDFGSKSGGTVVGYLQRARNLTYDQAVDEAWRLLERQGGVRDDRAVPRTRTSIVRALPQIDCLRLQHACALIADVVAGTDVDADRYLREERGLDPDTARELGEFRYVRSREHALAVSHLLHGHAEREMLLSTGFIKEGPDAKGRPRWMCWDRSLLIGCRGADVAGGDAPVEAWRARRCDWSPNTATPLPKYLNQSGEQGCHPFGWRALREAMAAHGDLIIVEGALDAVGARMLGRFALGMNTRPGTTKAESYAATMQAAWFRAHAAQLAACRRVLVLPDADDTPAAVAEGKLCADVLSGYLRSLQIAAEPTSMADLGFAGAKDLAKAADRRRHVANA